MADTGLTKPAPGVIATRPATAPVATPSIVGLPPWRHSTIIQETAAAEAAVFVVTKALAAAPSAAKALPALNPNQPTHRRAAPVTVNGKLCGGICSLGQPRRRPSSKAHTRADTPELIWTTVPPAKSKAPIAPIQPPPQTQCASGP